MNLRPLLLPFGTLVCGLAIASAACVSGTDGTDTPVDAGDGGLQADTSNQPKNVVAVGLGADHTCAAVGSAFQNDVKCWGSNIGNQITISSTDLQVKTPFLAGEGMVANAQFIVGGLSHTCVSDTGGYLWCWGTNSQGQLGAPEALSPAGPQNVDLGSDVTISSLAAAGAFTCVQVGDSTVKCWGANESGQIGKDSATNPQLNSPTTVSVGGSVASLCTGDSHACVVIAGKGNVKCWGHNDQGQLGDGTTKSRPNPMQVLSAGSSSPPLEDATTVICGANHTCAMTKGNGLKCWGANNAGQLGLGNSDAGTTPKSSKPLDVYPSNGAAQVVGACAGGFGHLDESSAYRGFTCARVSGEGGGDIVQCWGANELAQLGNGTTSDTDTPTTVPELQGVSGIACGGAHVCAIIGQTEPKTLKCWGSNASGQLGIGTSDPIGYFPADVTGL